MDNVKNSKCLSIEGSEVRIENKLGLTEILALKKAGWPAWFKILHPQTSGFPDLGLVN